jgi:hypothetical protein
VPGCGSRGCNCKNSYKNIQQLMISTVSDGNVVSWNHVKSSVFESQLYRPHLHATINCGIILITIQSCGKKIRKPVPLLFKRSECDEKPSHNMAPENCNSQYTRFTLYVPYPSRYCLGRLFFSRLFAGPPRKFSLIPNDLQLHNCNYHTNILKLLYIISWISTAHCRRITEQRLNFQ